jgi:hypothetical protein
MKMARVFVILIATLFTAKGLAAEDFVFHCVDDERTPIWSSFTVVPVHNIQNPDEDPRYQLVYIPKGERIPRLIDLTRVSVKDNAFTVQGSIKMTDEAAEKLRQHLRDDRNEALFNEDPENVEVVFQLSFKVKNILSKNAEENKDVGAFIYKLQIENKSENGNKEEILVDNPVDPIDTRHRAYCIRSGVAKGQG